MQNKEKVIFEGSAAHLAALGFIQRTGKCHISTKSGVTVESLQHIVEKTLGYKSDGTVSQFIYNAEKAAVLLAMSPRLQELMDQSPLSVGKQIQFSDHRKPVVIRIP